MTMHETETAVAITIAVASMVINVILVIILAISRSMHRDSDTLISEQSDRITEILIDRRQSEKKGIAAIRSSNEHKVASDIKTMDAKVVATVAKIFSKPEASSKSRRKIKMIREIVLSDSPCELQIVPKE